MGFILFLLAYLLYLPLSLINFFILVYQKKSKGYFRSSAINLDRFGNREFRTLFNVTLKKKEGYEFGNINETISSALGKNQRDGTLTKAGETLAWSLDYMDENHCENAIDF